MTSTEHIAEVIETADKKCPKGCVVNILVLTLAAEVHELRAKSHRDDRRNEQLGSLLESRKPLK